MTHIGLLNIFIYYYQSPGCPSNVSHQTAALEDGVSFQTCEHNGLNMVTQISSKQETEPDWWHNSTRLPGIQGQRKYTKHMFSFKEHPYETQTHTTLLPWSAFNHHTLKLILWRQVLSFRIQTWASHPRWIGGNPACVTRIPQHIR